MPDLRYESYLLISCKKRCEPITPLLPEIEKVFNAYKDTLAWPWITVICDICRADLLFEIEATAMLR